MARFCARCGVEESKEIKIIGYLCQNCFLKEKELAYMPSELRLVICPSCGSMKIGDSWISQRDFNSDLRIPLSIMLSTKIKPANEFVREIEIRSIDIVKTERGLNAEILVEGKVNDVILSKKYVKRVVLEKNLCPICMARKGKSYEALIQVRGFPKLSREKYEEILEYISSLPENVRDLITRIDQEKEGLDLMVSSKNIALYIANLITKEYGGVISSVTDKDIRETPRGRTSKKVISIRILDLRKGERVVIKGEPYIFEEISGDSLYLINRNGSRVKYSIDQILRMLVKHS
ncbi:MAG: 60S ribosomal export protein NMD3 [Sulfolobales archaeon]